MAATEEAFSELTGIESLVDIDRLRELAFYGIPNSIRGDIWNILIPAMVIPKNMSDVFEVSESNKELEEFEDALVSEEFFNDFDVFRVLKLELAKYNRRDLFKSLKQQERLRRSLIAYLQKYPNSWHMHNASLIHVLGPLILLMKSDSDVNTNFDLLMHAIESHFNAHTGRKVLGNFLMFFRSRLPALFTHFEEEDLDPSRWAASWLQWLLCRELPMDCCLRLWDSYFSGPNGHGFRLHTFVCLAILENCQTDLMELENQELMGFLQHLPSFDMDRIIVQAQYLAHDFRNT